MLDGMNLYVIAGIIFIVLVLLYVIYLLFFKSSTSFDGIKDLRLLTEKPMSGRVQYKGDLQAFGSNINNRMVVGFVLYLVSPENNINNRRNIFSIYDKQVPTPMPGSGCKERVNNYSTPGDAAEFPGVYLLEDGSTIQFVFQMEDGSTQMVTFPNFPYNKISVVNLFMDRKYVDIYLDGELAKTHQFTKTLDFRTIRKASASFVSGYCEGFSGYLYNVELWNKFLNKKQLLDYVTYSKTSYEAAAKSSNISGNEIIPCAQ
jgi:hypothetical protein